MSSKNTHKAYRQVCCKEPLSFGLKITSLVSFGFAPFNLYCYGKPLDLDRAENHWGHHNGVWQLLFSHLFGSKIKIPGKVNTGWMEISRTSLGTAVKSESLSFNVLRRCRIHALQIRLDWFQEINGCLCAFISKKYMVFRKFRAKGPSSFTFS